MVMLKAFELIELTFELVMETIGLLNYLGKCNQVT